MKFRIAGFGKFFILVLMVTGLVLVGVSMLVRSEVENAGKSWQEFEYQSSEKLRTLINLDHALGYGGMIHHYKNYLLRGDEVHRIETVTSIEEIRSLLLDFQKFASFQERESIHAIEATIELYLNNLAIIEAMKKQGRSLGEIDSAVIVDDDKAFEGINVLSRSIRQTIQNEARQLGGALDEVQAATRQQIYIVVIAFVLLIAGSVYLIWYRVIMPLGVLSGILSRLADGDFKAQVTGVYAKDEIGELAHMLRLYKKKSIEVFKAEREIKTTRKRYADILELAPDAIISINNAHEIVIFNQGAEKGFGYKAEEVLGKHVNILVPDYYHDRHDGDIESFSKGGESVRPTNMRPSIQGLKKNGEILYGEGTISNLVENGEMFLTIFIRDMSEQIERNEQLMEAKFAAEFANRSKSDFLANMSHELRTPLHAIIGFSGLLMDSDVIHLPEEKQREYSKDINESGQHLLALISDLLDLSKIEAGKKELNEQQVQPLDMINSSLSYIKVRAEDEKIAVIVEESDVDTDIDVDARMLKQMLINLLSNAVKFTPAGGEINISHGLESNGDYAIRVSDTGIGILPEHINSVLQPFWQVDTDLERTNEGTGLGLPLVKSLIELHGGALEIQSEINVGTTVGLIFPAERVARDSHAAINVI